MPQKDRGSDEAFLFFFEAFQDTSRYVQRRLNGQKWRSFEDPVRRYQKEISSVAKQTAEMADELSKEKKLPYQPVNSKTQS